MEYAVIQFNQGKRLVHANEMEILELHENEIQILMNKRNHLKILLGTFKPQYEVDKSDDFDSVHALIIEVIGSELAYIMGNQCHLLKLIDIMTTYQPNSGNISFAALIEGHISVSKLSIPAFVRVNDISLKENIINRFGIFSFERELKGYEFSNENWKDVVLSVQDNDSDDEEVEEYWGLQLQNKRQLLNEFSQKKSLYSDTVYVYHLTHTYNIEDRKTKLFSTIEPYTMDLLIAHIQFHASEIDMHYGMSQQEIKMIVEELYNKPTGQNIYDHHSCEIDLYINWEWWCAEADEIMKMELFKHDHLQGMLEKIIPKG
ncbi:hypothetical protein ABES02_29300 [Neobacillus pocheonensis]|uniref:hypothetical protein n=1 Tax=Neobacillus pocheonensis TaxID=363869 RepID=UPI003D27B31B